MIQLECSSWTDFKATCITKKNLPCQYGDETDRYVLYGPDGRDFVWHYNLLKTDPASEEQTDFEGNHKANFNWAMGDRPYPFSTSDFDFQRKGMFDTVNTDDFDMFMQVWDDKLYLNGGTLYCGTGFVFGTWAEMAIVDHDNILGHGVDFVVKTWILSSYPAADGKCEIQTPYAGNPPKNLYIRVRLHRVGSETFPVAVNLNFHKAI